MLVVSTDDNVDGYLDAGVALFRLLNYISEEYDETQAFTSMVSVSILLLLIFKGPLCHFFWRIY